MALAMPRPITRAGTGVYHFNVRVPADLAGKMRAMRVTLPLDDALVTVVVTDKVAFSLRTKDPATAKSRFTPAYAALSRHFDSLRAGPKPLTHKQIVGLAGLIYQDRVARDDDDPRLGPDHLEREIRAWTDILGDDRAADQAEPATLDEVRRATTLAHAYGDALVALQFRDPDEAEIDRLRGVYGPELDAMLASHQLVVDEDTERRLLVEIDRAAVEAAEVTIRHMEGDFAPAPTATRFPSFERPVQNAAPRSKSRQAVESINALYERWKTSQAESKAPSTLRRYGPSVESLDRFSKGRDWRLLAASDVFNWANHRCAKEGISAATVNRNDLVAVASILGWATSVNGKKMPEANVAFGIKVQRPKVVMKREKMFRAEEISAILRLTRSVKPDPRYPRASASRRWVSWLCAYSGSRVQETLWLQKSDIRKEAGIDVMCLPRTKNGHARIVPIHQALIDEGFLEFVNSTTDGWLFVGDRPPKEGSTRTVQEMRAAELASWVQTKVRFEDGVSPLHGWRHTWITYAEAAGIPPRLSNRITGHNMSDVSGRYVGMKLSLLAAEMAKFPRYEI